MGETEWAKDLREMTAEQVSPLAQAWRICRTVSYSSSGPEVDTLSKGGER